MRKPQREDQFKTISLGFLYKVVGELRSYTSFLLKQLKLSKY